MLLALHFVLTNLHVLLVTCTKSLHTYMQETHKNASYVPFVFQGHTKAIPIEVCLCVVNICANITHGRFHNDVSLHTYELILK